MDDRMQRALDGDLAARSGLDEREAEELLRAEDLIRNVVRSIPAAPIPDLAPAVLRRIAALPTAAPIVQPRPWWQHALHWFWSPRQLTMHWRPAYAAAFALLIGLFSVLRPVPTNSSGPVGQQVLVQFRLDAPNASQVQLAGNFTNWKTSVAMKRSGSGVWTVVLPLAPGVHSYAFVVNGTEWVADPMAQPVSDGFGGTNSQLAVLTPDESRS
jgi:hypothetical protein